jgi:hypothetical protein
VISSGKVTDENIHLMCNGSGRSYLGDQKVAPCRVCGVEYTLMVEPRPFPSIWPWHYSPGLEPK